MWQCWLAAINFEWRDSNLYISYFSVFCKSSTVAYFNFIYRKIDITKNHCAWVSVYYKKICGWKRPERNVGNH